MAKAKVRIDDLVKEVVKLSNEDKKEFFKRFGVESDGKYVTGKLVYDETVDAGPEPIITIKYEDGTEEKIDIMAMVRRDPCDVGHPVVVRCI